MLTTLTKLWCTNDAFHLPQVWKAGAVNDVTPELTMFQYEKFEGHVLARLAFVSNNSS